MKGQLYIIGLMGILSACADPSVSIVPVEFIGTWKLTEILADPGDGSGQFAKTSIDMSLEIFDDNTFKANRVMCDVSGGLFPFQAKGIFDVKAGTLTPDNCSFSRIIYYEIVNNHLVLSYVSDESYLQKFEKIDSANID